MDQALRRIVCGMPKAELHIHIEGSLEPGLIFDLAHRNSVALSYPDVDSLRRAYDFKDLQSFLDIYYAGASVLLKEQDFYDMTWAYLERAQADNVRHVEMFFDPQTHTARGVPFAFVIDGISRALQEAHTRFGMSSGLIMCFLRHLSEEDAFQTLEQALPHLPRIMGVGLDSSERAHPPEKFARVFARCRELGLHLVAHAGEEGPPDYIRQALDTLDVERIDHGVRCLEDPALVARLAQSRIPLTVCPLSNVRLRVFEEIGAHNLGRLLASGLAATVNSDDPAYFGGYINDNFVAAFDALGLTAADAKTLAANSFEGSFLPDEEKRARLQELEQYFSEQGGA